MKSICEEKKKQKDYTFHIYILGECFTDYSIWGSVISNSKNDKKNLLLGKHSISNENRVSLLCLIESIDSILNTNSTSTNSIVIECYTNNIYCMNIVNEWLDKWKKERFINRPNLDLLEKLNGLLDKCKLNIHYINLLEHSNGKLLQDEIYKFNNTK